MNFDIKKKFQTKPKNKIGLDIGSSYVKMLEIETTGEKSALISLGLKKAPSAVRETLVETIRSLGQDLKVTTKEVNISVSGPSVIVRFVSMPKMRDEELKSAIRFEAEKYIPFAINDCIIDHQILKKNERENKLDMLLVAVKKDFVLDRINVAEESGFTVGVVDVDTFAVANSYLKNFPTVEAGKTTALLNIGAKFTNVGIILDGIICFARDVAIGGDHFDQAISRDLNIDVKAVEDIKLSPKEKLPDIISCTKSVANSLLDEMRLSFSYYENQGGRFIDEIYISGGSSGLAGLEILFQEAFESKPHFFDPLQFLDKSERSFDPDLIDKAKGSFATAAGLALR